MLGDISLEEKNSGKKQTGSRLVLGISEYIKHPEYAHPSSYNDIALIRLDQRINITRSILPACLPDPEKRFDRKVNVTTAGWGRTGFAGMFCN